MVLEHTIHETVQACNDGGRVKTFAEFIVEIFGGKFVEIYLSDAYEEISLEQHSQSYPAVFCGKVVTAYRECLVLNSVYIDKSKQMQLGNLMFLSERAIKAINEINGKGIMEEMFLRSRESLIIKERFVDTQK
jgi:hypothetical protein